jgi:hypothetical protein
VYPILDAGELPPPPRRLVGRLEWTIEFSIPTDTPPAGDFYLEIVSARTKATGRTAGHLSVTADGAHDESDVGVWCVCGNVSSSTRAALGDYVQCDECGAWLHTACEGAGFQSERCVAKHFFFWWETDVAFCRCLEPDVARPVARPVARLPFYFVRLMF